MPNVQQLTTERLTLEPLRVEHAAEMVEVLADPALYEYVGGEAPTEADLVARYTRQVSRDDWLNWIVRRRDTEEPIGYVQVTLEPDAAELAWVTAKSAQGNGYATEATTAVIESLDSELLIAHIHPDHVASNAVARRLGFAPTDRLKDGEVRWELRLRCHN